MTDYQSLPPSVLAKIVQLDAHCLTLNTGLEGASRQLQELRQQQRELRPRTVNDEYEANREAERIVAERQRLADAIAAQDEIYQRQERRCGLPSEWPPPANASCTNCRPTPVSHPWKASREISMTSANTSSS